MNDTKIKKKRYSLALIIFICIMSIGILLFIYKTIFGMGDMFSIGFKYTAKKHYEFNIKPKNNTDLVTDLANTDIYIEKSSDQNVHITADIKIESDRLKKIPSDFITVDENNGIKIKEKKLDSSNIAYHQDYENTMKIKVPDKLLKKLYLNTTNSDISVNNVKASLDMNSTNGALSVDECSSNIEAKTTNSSIDVAFNVDSVKKISLITTNGSIDIEGLAFKNAHFNFQTTNGKIKLPNKFSHLVDKNKSNILWTTKGNGRNSYEAYSTNGDICFEN